MANINAALKDLTKMVQGKFPKGVSVDVPKYLREHGNPEAADKWDEMNEEYGDMLKKADTKVGITKQANQIANTILEQMGGARKLKLFLGVKRFVARPKGVWFQWPARKPAKTGNTLEVTLNSMDTYDMEFSYTTPSKGSRTIKKFKGIYFDMLVDIFEKHTGWYLRMSSKKAGHMPYMYIVLSGKSRLTVPKPIIRPNMVKVMYQVVFSKV